MKKEKPKKIKRLIFIGVILVGITALGCGVFTQGKKFFRHSRLFLITEIRNNVKRVYIPGVSRQIIQLPVELINNKNLFSVNIEAIATELKTAYPEFEEITVRRIFPHTLDIQFVNRVPVFQITIGNKFYLLDRDYVVISIPASEPWSGYLTVHTVFPQSVNPHIGNRIHLAYFDTAVALIEELKKQKFLKRYQIQTVYAYSLNDVWFNLEKMEIRVGADDYGKKLALLDEAILPQFVGEFNLIRYIDLRFKDYVIGHKRE